MAHETHRTWIMDQLFAEVGTGEPEVAPEVEANRGLFAESGGTLDGSAGYSRETPGWGGDE